MNKKILDIKKEQLLKAIVTEYIQSAAPVASLSLGGHYGLEASSATLRNWMAELESLGFLKQPHPSAGRIPTDKGYRHYVDLLMETENLQEKEKRRIVKELETGFHEIEDLVWGAAEIVSHIGGCTALAFYPPAQELALKRLELLQVSRERILLVLLTENGFVFDRIVEMEASEEKLEALSRMLNERLSGMPLSSVGSHLLQGVADEMFSNLVEKILVLIGKTVEEENKNRVVVEGTHLLLEQPEFQNLSKFKNALEVFVKRGGRLSRFLGRVGSTPNLHVFIGDENPIKDFCELSVIAAPYGSKEVGFGALAIVGPTRMEYGRLIPLVQYTTTILSRSLESFLS